MVSEAGRWGENVENRAIRAQSQSMTLSEIADGYVKQVEKIMSGPAAPVIRNEVKKYADVVSKTEGMQQYEHLNELVGRLDSYKSFFGGIWEDKDERPALALAFVRYEQSLH